MNRWPMGTAMKPQKKRKRKVRVRACVSAYLWLTERACVQEAERRRLASKESLPRLPAKAQLQWPNPNPSQ